VVAERASGLPDLPAAVFHSDVAVLIDFDNAFPNYATPPQLGHGIDRLIQLALERQPDAESVEIRLYGGWFEDGAATTAASRVLLDLGRLSLFPMRHPLKPAVLRGRVDLVTRMHADPRLEWAHTLRRRSGLPSVRLAEKPYPSGCVHESADCPVKGLQRFARRGSRQCSAPGCAVTNRSAFRVPEQKMVDTLMACDAISLALHRHPTLLVSSDLDVLPAVVMANALAGGSVTWVRPEARSSKIYDADLAAFGINVVDQEET
jgi:hypothetical protein